MREISYNQDGSGKVDEQSKLMLFIQLHPLWLFVADNGLWLNLQSILWLSDIKICEITKRILTLLKEWTNLMYYSWLALEGSLEGKGKDLDEVSVELDLK